MYSSHIGHPCCWRRFALRSSSFLNFYSSSCDQRRFSQYFSTAQSYSYIASQRSSASFVNFFSKSTTFDRSLETWIFTSSSWLTLQKSINQLLSMIQKKMHKVLVYFTQRFVPLTKNGFFLFYDKSEQRVWKGLFSLG